MKNVNNLTTHRSNRKLSENPRYGRSNSISGSETEKQGNSGRVEDQEGKIKTEEK